MNHWKRKFLTRFLMMKTARSISMVSLMQPTEREFEEDDSECEDLLADEDSALGDVSLNDIAWSN